MIKGRLDDSWASGGLGDAPIRLDRIHTRLGTHFYEQDTKLILLSPSVSKDSFS